MRPGCRSKQGKSARTVEENRPKSLAERFASLHYGLRTEGNSADRQAFAVGLGVFLGCFPTWGIHFPLCLVVSFLLGISPVITYTASHVNNPIVVPFLVFAEVQLGSWLRTGATYPISMATFGQLELWDFVSDLFLGSLVIGLTLGLFAGLSSFVVLRRWGLRGDESRLMDRTARDFMSSGISAWELANAKLRYDSVYRTIFERGLLPDEGNLVDIGCGQGVFLSLVIRARQGFEDGDWPEGWKEPPRGLELYGIEILNDEVEIARHALRDRATIQLGNALDVEIPRSRVALFLDILQSLSAAEQEKLLGRVAKALEPKGIMLVRESAASGGHGFRVVRLVERARLLLSQKPFREVSSRTHDEWIALLEGLGLDVETHAVGKNSPFTSSILLARKRS